MKQLGRDRLSWGVLWLSLSASRPWEVDGRSITGWFQSVHQADVWVAVRRGTGLIRHLLVC